MNVVNKNIIVKWKTSSLIWFNRTKNLESGLEPFEFSALYRSSSNSNIYYAGLDRFLTRLKDPNKVDFMMLTDIDSVDELFRLHPELFI